MTIELQNGVVIKINDENTEATIDESPNARDDVFIPRFVENKGKKVPITNISNRAFVDNEFINSLTFAEDSDLQTIRKGAFSHSTLEKLIIPSKVTTIEDGFCSSAKNLIHIEVSANNKNYVSINNEYLVSQGENRQGVLLFARRNIEDATIPDIVQKIGPYSFDKCKSLKSVNFSTSKVDELCNFSFNECSNLTQISIPSSVIRIGERCFNACKTLKNVSISSDSKLRRIEKLAFFHTPIEKLTIPPTTDELVDGFCSGTTSLNSIEVSPQNSKYISVEGEYLTTKGEIDGSELIFVRRNIDAFTIPPTIKKIGVYAFQTCHNLTTVTFSVSKSPHFTDTIDDHSFSECVKLETIEIPITVIKRIGKFSFSSCKNLKRVTFIRPNNDDSCVLETIDDSAFKGCEKLSEITIPFCVKKIGSSCFHTCSSLKKVIFEDGSRLESIGNYGFSYCSSLEIFEIPKSATQIGEFCFESCSALSNVKFDLDSQITVIPKSSFSYCSELAEFVLPTAVKTVENGAFKSCRKLNRILLANSNLSEIGIEAFDGCSSIEKVEVPNSLRQIRGSSFRACTSLSSFVFDDENCQLELIGDSAFNNCASLKKFDVPRKVKRIGKSAFDSCKNLGDVTIHENSELQFIGAFAFSNTLIKKIFVPRSVEKIEDGFGFNTMNLNKVDVSNLNNYYKCDGDFVISKSSGNKDDEVELVFARKDICDALVPLEVKKIGKYAFSNCALLKTINFDSKSGNDKCSLEIIDDFAFTQCLALTDVVIPNTVKKIGKSSFASCTNLKSVIFEEPTNMEELEFNSFEDCPNLKSFERPSSLRRISRNISDFFDINPK